MRWVALGMVAALAFAGCGGENDEEGASTKAGDSTAADDKANTTDNSGGGEKVCLLSATKVSDILGTEVIAKENLGVLTGDVCRYTPTSGKILPNAAVFFQEGVDCSEKSRTSKGHLATFSGDPIEGVDIEVYESDGDDAFLLVCVNKPFQLAVESDNKAFKESAVRRLLELVPRD